MNKLTPILILLINFQLFAQEKYSVTAKNGLIIRDKPSINSSRLGIFNENEIINVFKKTKIKFKTRTKKGFWYKVKINNNYAFVFSGFLKKVSNCNHSEIFNFKFFKKYKEYCLTDTISIDLNGNGILEKIYFDKKDCTKLIIEEKGEDLISIGCLKEEYKGFPNAIDWVNLWCVVYEKETYEVVIEDEILVGEKSINIERPSIYIGKEEGGGGIITYRKGKLYWIHQSD